MVKETFKEQFTLEIEALTEFVYAFGFRNGVEESFTELEKDFVKKGGGGGYAY